MLRGRAMSHGRVLIVDGDTRADLAVGSGANQPSQVKVFLGKDVSGTAEPTATAFDPFGAVTLNGVFVG